MKKKSINHQEELIIGRWIDSHGGVEYVRLLNDLGLWWDSQDISQDPQELFEMSRREFLADGKSEIEHQRWRQRELKWLCLIQLRHLQWDLNRKHPEFAEHDNDYELEAAEYQTKPIKLPSIARNDLEAEITKWYLRTQKETAFVIPGERHDSANADEYESVTYLRWELDLATKEKPPSPPQQGEQGATDRKKEIHERTQSSSDDSSIAALNPYAKKWVVALSDLTGPELNCTQVCIQIKEWLKEDPELAEKDIEEIQDTFAAAQRRASEKHRIKGIPLPVRVGTGRSKYLFHKFAMIDLGEVGRKKAAAKFRKIKADQSSLSPEQSENPSASDEPQQD